MQKIGPVRIGKHLVGPGQPVFIVAEIGINHNGDVEIAKQLIDVAVTAGADAVKFQTRTVETVYGPLELSRPRPDLAERGFDFLKNAIRRGVIPKECLDRLKQTNFRDVRAYEQKCMLEFTDEEYADIARYCKDRNILWFTSCWDEKSVERMEKFDLPCHKVASPCNEDDNLLKAVRQTGRPIILSTGMTDIDGVRAAIQVLGTENLVILHCTSVYPKGTGSPEEVLPLINLRGIQTLAREFSVPVGFSSHDTGIMPSYAAVTLGACVIEKHVTLERGMYGSDQSLSIEPNDLLRLCRAVRELRLAMGNGEIVIYPNEHAVIDKLRRVRRKMISV